MTLTNDRYNINNALNSSLWSVRKTFNSVESCTGIQHVQHSFEFSSQFSSTQLSEVQQSSVQF
jgi:hypothetical protein